MKTLTCPFCGATAEQKALDLGGNDDPSLMVENEGIATFAWEDDGETAYENNIQPYQCLVHAKHIFFVPE